MSAAPDAQPTTDPFMTLDTGGRHRADGTGGEPDVGVEGNSRLTSVTGMVLLVMFAAEGATLLDIHGLLTAHMVIGLLLVGPVLLKTAVTLYRFVRYYTGAAPYKRRGAPNIVLRVAGPLVVLTSLAVVGTGVGLAFVHERGTLLLAHKASFVLWFIVMTLHVLGHVFEAMRTSAREFRRPHLPGAGVRLALVVLALAAGVATTAVVLPHASAWTQVQLQDQHER